MTKEAQKEQLTKKETGLSGQLGNMDVIVIGGFVISFGCFSIIDKVNAYHLLCGDAESY